MPNGGEHHCGFCTYYHNKLCNLRGIEITKPFWTTCKNWNTIDQDPIGELYAIIGEVRNQTIRYGQIPYYKGKRADTVQKANGDTIVQVRISENEILTFENVEDYLKFLRESES